MAPKNTTNIIQINVKSLMIYLSSSKRKEKKYYEEKFSLNKNVFLNFRANK